MTMGRDKFIRNLARGDLLVPHLERYADWDRPFEFKYEPKLRDDGFHPSGDCLPSVRDLYDKCTDLQREKISPGLQRTFLVGHFWHQVIQDALVEMEFASPEAIERKGFNGWSKPVKVEDGVAHVIHEPYHYSTGSGDVAPLEVGDWQGIMDIKTANDRSFKHVVTHGDFMGDFSPKYEAQLNCYMEFFNQPAAMILIVNKNDAKFAEIRYERNDELIDAIFSKWMYVSELLDADTVDKDDLDVDIVLPFKGPTK